MSKYQYDVIVIGGGSGGLVAARITTALGARVCLIDKERLGGDCLYSGCVPSKSLIHAAKIVKTAREAAMLGTAETEINFQVDMAKVAARIQGVIERVGEAEQVYVQNVDVKFGQAEFVGDHELSLNGQILTAKTFIIATGSHPRIPEIPGLARAGYLTNQDVFDLTRLPERLAVVGGGPIGVELAQAFARLGSKVTIIQGPDRLLPKEEPEMSGAVADALGRDGLEILTGTRLKKVSGESGPKQIEAMRGEEVIQLEMDDLLIAVGRQPNLEGLKLEAAGVKFSDKGIEVNEYLQTSAPNIYAIGDVIGGYLFTHVAAYQAGIASRNALVPIGRKKVDYRALPWVTFTDPEVSRVGQTEAEARQEHTHIKIIHYPWHDIDRAQADGETEGFIKLILNDKGQEILGAHLVGARSGEVLAEITLAMQHKLGISGILDTIHAYPTLATGLQSAAFEAYLSSSSLASAKKVLGPVLSFTG
jgi:dihydrolipoamide dehydrogenase